MIDLFKNEYNKDDIMLYKSESEFINKYNEKYKDEIYPFTIDNVFLNNNFNNTKLILTASFLTNYLTVDDFLSKIYKNYDDNLVVYIKS